MSSYEFRQIICPLNKHSQNKQHFGKIFKCSSFFKLTSTTMVFLTATLLDAASRVLPELLW